jgi:AcrR family transcriptional regulator
VRMTTSRSSSRYWRFTTRRTACRHRLDTSEGTGPHGLLTSRLGCAHALIVVAVPKRDRLAERREATRLEILSAAWDAAREASLPGLTLRDVAARVGMQPPSLYSHFASKNAIYDAMFEQAWREYLMHVTALVERLPDQPRARLIAIAEDYFDWAVADVARHQLMDENVIPGFRPSEQAYAPSLEVYALFRRILSGMGMTSDEDADVCTALGAGLVSQQLANDPGGQRWRRLIPRVMSMFADDVGLPPDTAAGPARPNGRARRKKAS